MIQELIIHIGDCKTGSTSIQNALSQGAYSCRETSVFYPAKSTQKIFTASHNGLAATLWRKGAPAPKQGFMQLAKSFEASTADIGIVSAEHFEFVSPVDLKAAIEAYLPGFRADIRIIAYVRPHGEQLLSRFVQMTKLAGFDGDLESFQRRLQRKRRLHYTPRFQKWRAVFGDRFTLRPMVRSHLSQGDVVHDFFVCVYGATAFSLKEFPHQNAALSVEDLALLRHMHTVLRAEPNLGATRKKRGRYLVNAIESDPDPRATKPRLHRAMAEKVAQIYQQDAAQLDAEFFEGTPISDGLQKSIETAVHAPQSFEAADYFSPETLRVACLGARALMSVMVDSVAAEGRRAQRLAKTRTS